MIILREYSLIFIIGQYHCKQFSLPLRAKQIGAVAVSIMTAYSYTPIVFRHTYTERASDRPDRSALRHFCILPSAFFALIMQFFSIIIYITCTSPTLIDSFYCF